MRSAKPEVGGNGVSGETATLNGGIFGSVYSLPVSGMRSLGASGINRAWRRGDTIYVVSGGQGYDGERVFSPNVAQRTGGASSHNAECRKVVYPYSDDTLTSFLTPVTGSGFCFRHLPARNETRSIRGRQV